MKAPQKLYKYMPFGVYALKAITEAEVYHASPGSFNDPMDCQPSLILNINSDQALRLLRTMLGQQGMEAQAIDKYVAEMRYHATNIWDENGEPIALTADSIAENMRYQCQTSITASLKQEMANRGVLSLSESHSSVLMWSHYADHHRGLCLEYDTTQTNTEILGKVNYGAARSVLASDLYRWKVNENHSARETVFQTYFYAKSGEWHYECEWRQVHLRAGVNPLPFELTGIYFGMRMDPTVQQTIIRVLTNNRNVALHNMWVERDTFDLMSSPADRDYIEQTGICEPPHIAFGRLPSMPMTDPPQSTTWP